MKYRAEIDGLRALAVIPVILFHAGFETFSGGFVGVDVFFVISGYLITTIILSEHESGRFSLVNFYERRARRILPALFLVMFASLPFAWFWLLPTDAKDFAQSLVAVSTFSSNIFFWQKTGYWGTASELQPLLHTWSLAVEEQYYVLFPLFLMMIWRFPQRVILGSFVAVAAVSLITAQWGAYRHPSATFFLLPTRAWELAVGASIAFYFLYRSKTVKAATSLKIIDELMSLLGLAMIGYSALAFNETIPFPSLFALVPTVGTGLIIVFSSSQTLVGRLLGTRPLVGIGLISYSAYLWHQPLFAFARHRTLTEPSDINYLGLSALSIALAFVSWKYVEKPFRKKGVLSRKAIFTFAATGSAFFVLIGLSGHLTDGFSGRISTSQTSLQEFDSKLRVNYGLSRNCEGVVTLSQDCRTSEEPEIAIIGDSFAMHLVQGILASNPNARLIQFTKSVCGPFFDIAPIRPPRNPVSWSRGCLEFTDQVRDWLSENESVRYAVLSSPFWQYINKEVLLRNGHQKTLDMQSLVAEFERTLEELIDMGVTPVIFSPLPEKGHDVGRCLVQATWFDEDLDECNFPLHVVTEENSSAFQFLALLDDKYKVIRFDELICSDESCRTHIGSVFLYRDSRHLSYEGSAALGKSANFYRQITDARSESQP